MSSDKPTTVVAAVLLGVVGVFAILAQPILVQVLVGRLGMQPGNAGLVTAVEALGTALGPLGALFWLQRVNRRMAAGFAIAVVIAGNLITSYQDPSIALLVPLRFAVGFLGEGTAFAVAMAIISSTEKKDRNFALLIAAQVALGVVSFRVLPFPRDAGIAGVLLPLAGLAFIGLMTVPWIPQSGGVARARADGAAAPASMAPAWMALIVMMIWSTGLGAVWAFVKLVGTTGGLEAAAVGKALSLTTLLAMIGPLSAAALGDRFGRIVPATLALLIQLVMVALMHGEMSWLQFVVIVGIFQVFWNFTGPYMMGTVALNDTTGKVSLLIPTSQIGGFFLGPTIVKAVMTMMEGSLLAVNYVAGTCILLGMLLFIPAANRVKGAATPRGH